MPIYEYECPKCGEFEFTQRITEDALKKCPTCKSKVRKLISNTSFQLKGSGWYVTDYGGKKGGGKDSSAKDGGDKGSSGSSTSDSSSSSSDAKSSDSSTKSDPPKKSPSKDTSAKAA